MALNPNIALAGNVPQVSLASALMNGISAGEAIRNAPLIAAMNQQKLAQARQSTALNTQTLQSNEMSMQDAKRQRQVQDAGFVRNAALRAQMASDDPAEQMAAFKSFIPELQNLGIDMSDMPEDATLESIIQQTSTFVQPEQPQVLNQNQISESGQVTLMTSGGPVAIDVPGMRLPDPKREVLEDQNGVKRYTDDGSPVFPDVEAVAEELSGKDKLDIAEGLRKEIADRNDDFEKIANSWDRIAASADDPSAAGDLALIFNFMKMLDPGSTVREGEFANAQNSGGVDDRIRSTYNQLINGERLSPAQREDFLGQSQNIFNATKERADMITEEFVRIGAENGIPRSQIVVSRGKSPVVTMLTQSEIDAEMKRRGLTQ